MLIFFTLIFLFVSLHVLFFGYFKEEMKVLKMADELLDEYNNTLSISQKNELAEKALKVMTKVLLIAVPITIARIIYLFVAVTIDPLVWPTVAIMLIVISSFYLAYQKVFPNKVITFLDKCANVAYFIYMVSILL